MFRSFWQGYSKRVMELLYSGAQGNESAFLRDLVVRALPSRTRRTILNGSTVPVKEAVAILAFAGAVGLGYLYALTKRGLLRQEDDEGKPAGIDEAEDPASD